MKKILFTIVLLAAVGTGCRAQGQAKDWKYTSREWKQIARNCPDSFLKTDEARSIAENVLAWQRVTGGWPKNQPLHKPLNDEEKARLAADKQKRNDSTTDNDATITEMTFLARMYHATGEQRYKEAFLRGVEWLLSGQYENGGWPQFWPENRDYQVHITYNDNAMVQTLQVIRSLRDRKAPIDLVDDPALLQRLTKSFEKGIECILATQIRVNGRPTVWCQQHDHISLAPAKARAYELPSFCSSESVHIVELLMQLPNPSERVKASIEGAVAWLKQHQITGITTERFTNTEGKPDLRVVKDTKAEPIWARYYDLKTEKPFFCDRDGIPVATMAEVGYERRNGYGWYNRAAAKMFKEYERWKLRVAAGAQ